MAGRSEWRGTATQLKDDLEEQAGEKLTRTRDWPKRANLVSGQLRRIAPNLRRMGWSVEMDEKDPATRKFAFRTFA